MMLKRVLARDTTYWALLIVVNLFFFGDILFTEKTLFYRDIGNWHYALKRLVVEAYSRDTWPLWNPYIQFGQPLLANPNAMAVYPTQLLFHVLPFWWAFDLNLVVHCMVGGIGAFCLGRSLGLSRVASFAVGLSYNFNGVVISLINLPLLGVTAGLLPWLALVLKKVVQRPSILNVACLSVLVALVSMALEPLTFAAAALFLAPFVVYSWLTGAPRQRLRLVVFLLLIGLISGILLAAIQLLPTMELLANCDRQKGLEFGKAAYWSVHPFTLTQMLFPAVWQDSFRLTTSNQSWSDVFFEGREAYIVSSYWGLSCLVFVLLGLLFSESRALKWMLAAVSLVAIILALGKYTPVYSILYSSLPPLRLGRYPAKYLLATSLSFGLLAGLGVDQIERLWRRLRLPGGIRRLLGLFGVVAFLVIVAGLISFSWGWEAAGFQVANGAVHLESDAGPVQISLSSIRQAAVYLFVMLSCASAVVLLAGFVSRIPRPLLMHLAAGLVFFDLCSNHAINPAIPSAVYERSPVTEWLLKQSPGKAPFRVYHVIPDQATDSVRGPTDSEIWRFVYRRLSALPYTAASDHLEYSSLPTVDRLESASSQRIHQRVLMTRDLDERIDCLSCLNTCYVLSAGRLENPNLVVDISFPLNSKYPTYVYRLKECLPRAFLMEKEQKKRDCLGLGLPGEIPADRAEGEATGVAIVRHTPDRVELEADADRESTLVLLDSYYPGWRAWVNGREVGVQRVAEAFRGVKVPAGKSRVTFAYDPKSFAYGRAVTLFAACAWICALSFSGYRSRRRKRAPISGTGDADAG